MTDHDSARSSTGCGARMLRRISSTTLSAESLRRSSSPARSSLGLGTRRNRDRPFRLHGMAAWRWTAPLMLLALAAVWLAIAQHPAAEGVALPPAHPADLPLPPRSPPSPPADVGDAPAIDADVEVGSAPMR